MYKGIANGRAAFGYLVSYNENGTEHCRIYSGQASNGEPDWVEVDPASVRCFTNCRDRNQQCIFEGDTISVDVGTGRGTRDAVVVFMAGNHHYDMWAASFTDNLNPKSVPLTHVCHHSSIII